MSAFGFGLLLGSFGAVVVAVNAFSKDNINVIQIIIVVLGFFGLLVGPSIVGGLPDFLIGALSPPVLLYALRYKPIQKNVEAKRIEVEAARLKREDRQRLRQCAQDRLTDYLESLTNEGWRGVCNAKLLADRQSQDCAVMLSDDRGDLRIVVYELGTEFTCEEPLTFHLRDILSLTVARPKITKTRKKIAPVSIVENKRKSPVARGILGGVLLGPAGLVVGAASGLNSKTITKIEQHEVTEFYEAEGDPQLIIGTTRDDYPVLKMKFDPTSDAEKWMFRIQAAQRR